MAKKKQIELDPEIEQAMLGETALEEIRQFIDQLPSYPTFEQVEQGAVKVAQRVMQAIMQSSLQMAAEKTKGEKKNVRAASLNTSNFVKRANAISSRYWGW